MSICEFVPSIHVALSASFGMILWTYSPEDNGPSLINKSFPVQLPSCQPRVTVTSCFVYKTIRDLKSIEHLCINPIRRIGLIHEWSIDRVSSSDVYKLLFYLTIVNKTYVTITLGWHDSTVGSYFPFSLILTKAFSNNELGLAVTNVELTSNFSDLFLEHKLLC